MNCFVRYSRLEMNSACHASMSPRVSVATLSEVSAPVSALKSRSSRENSVGGSKSGTEKIWGECFGDEGGVSSDDNELVDEVRDDDRDDVE